MDIQADKILLAKMILDTDNPKIIESIKKIFKTEKPVDFWNELTFEQRKEIEDASLEIERGEVIEYESFMKKHR